MRVPFFAATVAVLAGVALAKRNITASDDIYSKVKADIKADSPTSSAEPRKPIPVDWHTLAQAGALAQEPYCVWQKIGTKIGDSVLEWKSEDANSKPRVSVFQVGQPWYCALDPGHRSILALWLPARRRLCTD